MLDYAIIYAKLEAIDVTLEDVSEPDPRYILGKIIECRAGLKAVQKIFLDVTKEKNSIQIKLTTAETSYEIRKDNSLANDPDVKIKSSIQDRLATINSELVELKQDIHGFKSELEQIKNIEKLINLYNKNLNA